MGQNCKIEWCHHSFNPWRGCTKVSEGCKFCYADQLSRRNPKALCVWGPQGERVIAAESYWQQPLKWNEQARRMREKHARHPEIQEPYQRPRVFSASLADVFEGPDTMPDRSRMDVEQARARLLALITATPELDWLLLTKRPEGIVERLLDVIRFEAGDSVASLVAQGWVRGEPPANVWIGTSCENQNAADERIPHLLRCPARVRFLSCEPLLGVIDLNVSRTIGAAPGDVTDEDDAMGPPLGGAGGIDWVIAGGESGPHARAMSPAWARQIRDQCTESCVSFFMNPYEQDAQPPFWNGQDGRMIDGHIFPPDIDSGPVNGWWCPDILDAVVYRRVGKKAAGRLLDGREWNEFPKTGEVAHA